MYQIEESLVIFKLINLFDLFISSVWLLILAASLCINGNIQWQSLLHIVMAALLGLHGNIQ